MSTEERARILRMVADGKLTAEEAADLLEALEAAPVPASRAGSAREQAWQMPEKRGRSLVITITEGSATTANIRIPLALARAAGRFVPRRAQEQLEDYGVDLKQLLADLGDSLVEGPLIEIQDEEDHVRIAVE